MRAPITILLLAAAALTPAALAFAPDETVHIGVEPARIVRYHKEVQHRLGQSAAWAAFQADFGETWQARFDERTGLPHRAWGPGIDLGELQDAQDLESSLRDLIARHPQLFGVSGAELGPARIGYIARTDTWYATFDQQVQGVPVWRGGLTFRVRFGKLVLFGVETHPAARGLSVSSQLNAELAIQEAVRQGPAASAFHDAPEARLIVFPEERDGQLHYRLAWETRTRTSSPPGLWVSLIDARSGELLHVWNEVRFLTGPHWLVHHRAEPADLQRRGQLHWLQLPVDDLLGHPGRDRQLRLLAPGPRLLGAPHPRGEHGGRRADLQRERERLLQRLL
ncbi:hypothetical protein L6R49_17175 [Myxococcota bacterium]|nr:hypothetical protein [Myxococcota bacterium]